MTFPEYDAATTARHDAATVEDPKLARRRKAMTGKPDHVFTTTFSDTDGQSQVVSINRSFDGAVLAAWYALKDYGYEEDFLVRAQDHLDATDVSEFDEANHEHMKEALTNAMLLEGDLSGQRLEFDLDTDQYKPVAASFTIELHHVED